MKKVTVKPFSATIYLGLQRGYTGKVIKKSKVISYLQKFQDQIIEERDLHLSICLSECEIVMSGQVEPHLRLSMINYPRFPMECQILKREIEYLARSIMNEYEQNRIVIEYLDETVMFEQSDEIDPGIRRKK